MLDGSVPSTEVATNQFQGSTMEGFRPLAVGCGLLKSQWPCKTAPQDPVA